MGHMVLADNAVRYCTVAEAHASVDFSQIYSNKETLKAFSICLAAFSNLDASPHFKKKLTSQGDSV